jgi:zinc protease
MLFRLLSLPVLVLSLVTTAPAADPDADAQLALRTAGALYDGIRTATLDNGLRLYLKAIPGAPSVTTMVAYRVGSADEDLDQTGLSHYLEHLMFKGTEKIKPGDIDRVTFRGGGANNAYTSEDYTIFHFDFPPDRWLAGLEIEADRMQNLRIDEDHEFQQEKGAVINELMRNEDTPWDLESKEILPLLFGKAGPYGHPVIGQREHVRGATAEIIKKHYDRWYHPNNAALIIVGAIDPDKALADVKRLFGSIPAAKLPPRKTLPKADLARPARIEMASKFAVPRLLMGFNTPDRADPDDAVLTVLGELLSQGKTGRLVRVLVEKNEEAMGVSAGNSSGRYPGWFSIQVEVAPGKDRKAIEEHVLAELKKLAETPPEAAELRRVQRGILASAIFARESVHGLADSIAQGVIVTDLDHLRKALPRILAVTPGDVQRAARKYLDPEKRVTLWSVPKADKGGKEPPPPAKPNRSDARRAAGGAGEGFSLQKTRRVVLPNGLVLLLFEDHRLPLFVAAADVADVRLAEPADKLGVATLTGYLLDEGTTRHKGPEIAEMIEGVGGVLSLNAGGGSVRVLSRDRKLGLSLLLECLMQPAFPEDAFGRVQQRLIGEIEDNDTQPDARARDAFRAAVYGAHPLGRRSMGTVKSVAKLTPKDCAEFHSRLFVPDNTVIAIVGDFDSDEIIEEVTRLTKDWKKSGFKLGDLPEVTLPAEASQSILSMPSAAQLHFFMGHAGIRRSNPDYYKLLVLDYILGTGPGFTDRLSSRLRDREGLAYTVNATIASSAGRQPGMFAGYIGTDNDNFARVKKEFLEELNRIRDKKASAGEVEDAKTYLAGSLLLRLTTLSSIAEQLLAIERNHLGFNYLEQYRKGVLAVTPEDVQEVAKKYLHPDRMVIVAAGAVDATTGEPLKKEKKE